MSEIEKIGEQLHRRAFLEKTSYGLGMTALASLLRPLDGLAGQVAASGSGLGMPHFPAKVKRVIYLFQSGAPSQLDLFDYKPGLQKMWGQDLPPSVRNGQRLTGMSSGQRILPLAPTIYPFQQRGQSGAWVSQLMPYTAGIADELTFIKTMYTEAINHDPAVTFVQTGSQQAGRPSIGSWLSYGLGADNQNLPSFVVMLSRSNSFDQPLYAKLWGNGFLPSQHQGVMFRNGPDPVLYLSDSPGIDRPTRRRMLDALGALSHQQFAHELDPEINARLSQYEMAYRMQMSVPETVDIRNEPAHILKMYGDDAHVPGTFAYNCLLARKLAEKEVKFIQLYHQGWDHHGSLPGLIPKLAKDTDQASAALVMDLKQRGLLEDTLVIWGGEFGRTNYSQGKLSKDNYGRDHHPRCFTIWMAGAGVKKGISYGQTDDLGYNIARDPVHIHDFQATLMHLLGIDHERFTFKHQGRRYRLTDVHGKVVKGILV
jgi:Protein of unknown function (DUF1501)